MNHFHYVNNEFWCENIPITRIAAKVKTPFYLYSYETLRHHFQVFHDSFAGLPHIVCFAAKANSNLAILRTFFQLGGGADIVSGGELYRSLQAGVDPRKVVYSGVGKKVEEIEYALMNDILMFNVESPQELEVISRCAERLGKKASIALRVNPDVDPQTHSHISTGLKENKFGIDMETAREQYRIAKYFKNLVIIGVSCHIGSQITKISPFLEALSHVINLVKLLKNEEGIPIKYIDLGGGLGIQYHKETPPHPSEYAQALITAAGNLDCTFILEPGRVLVGNAGILVTKVLYTKANEEKNFIIIDAGMNDLIRPSLYDSYHHIQPIVKNSNNEVTADIVGPICESGDYLAKGRKLTAFKQNDLMAVMSAGAYGFSMSSNYNSRTRIAEVLAKDDKFFIIRKREVYRDLIKGETIPAFLKPTVLI